MPPACSLKTTVRQSPAIAEGLTQASSVMPVVRSGEGESGTVPQLEVPLSESAPPYFPAVDQDVFAAVPLLPLPEESVTAAPPVSSKLYASTGPVLTAAAVVAACATADAAAAASGRRIRIVSRRSPCRTAR